MVRRQQTPCQGLVAMILIILSQTERFLNPFGVDSPTTFRPNLMSAAQPGHRNHHFLNMVN
jgi:hypothetical protein